MKFFLKFKEWYSTGSYFWAKTIVESIPTIINSFCYTFIIYYMSGQFLEDLRFYKFLWITTVNFLCTQSLGSCCGIIFYKNHRLAIYSSITLFLSLTFYNNFTIPTKELFPIAKVMSDFAYPKFVFNSILITIYGFGRCPPGQTSLVLYQYDINDDQIFWDSSKYLIYSLIFFKSSEIILLMIKANRVSLRFGGSSKTSNDDQIKFRNILKENDDKNNNNLEVQVYLPNKYTSIDFKEPQNKKLMIGWIDLSYTVPQKLFSNQTKILDNISGGIEVGSLNALMGPSGAGKTTLLKCLNGRNNLGLSEQTKIYLSSSHRIRTCFITQNQSEHLLDGLTVKQTLIYASKLKNSNSYVKVNHQKIIKDLMSELMISETENTYVENCSGGQQKRIVIASELISYVKPNILFIDEPTSGLDSDAAEVVSIFQIIFNF